MSQTRIPLEERSNGLYRLLKTSLIYDLSMQLVTRRGAASRFVESFIRPQPGMRILDFGSGTSTILGLLPDVDYVAVEPNPHYVASASKRYGTRGDFICGGVETLQGLSGQFDRILAIGVLHHVSDTLAQQFFVESARLLQPGGRVVTLDGGFTPDQRPLARLMVSRDRGGFVRSLEHYRELATSSGLQVRAFFSDKLTRIPYSHVCLVCE